MAFLKPEDYQVQVRAWVTDILTDGGPSLLERAEMSAEQEMESYLGNRYDVGLIFSPDQAEEDRNSLIVMYMVDIATYHLHANITPNDVPEIRQIRYDNAIAWLNKVMNGKLSPNLPVPPVADGDEDLGSSQFQGGSNDVTSYRY